MSIQQIFEIPQPQEYCEMRVKAGLSPKSLAAAEKGLPNSLFAVCLREQDKLVGMGRVIGDGACFFEIVDIAVDPDYQGKGFGKQIMLAIEDYLADAAMEGSYVSMVADVPEFYKPFGYKFMAPKSQGMFKWLKPREDS